MRITRLIAATLLIGTLLVLGACTSVTPVPPTPKSTVFITSNLTIDPIDPTTWQSGDTTQIGVTVTNTGEQPGTYTVVLKVTNNQTRPEDILTQDVTLNGGASQRVTFHYVTYFEGTFVVTIDQLQGFLVVNSA